MRYTANDIRGATFSRRLRGADEAELQVFLGGVADQLEQLERELSAAQARGLQLERELERYRSLDQGLRDTLLEMKTTSEGARETARREAELILKDAEFRAGQLLARGNEEQRALQVEVETLRDRRDSFVRRIRSLLEQQLELLELMAHSEPAAGGRASEEEARAGLPSDH
jgi:cell division initiation protein